MDIELLNKKREKLQLAKKLLKEKFVGLDDIVDQIILNLEAWYLMPEVINRPIIISLWGLTGVGKTDLVRRLVKILEFSDRYLEVQMDTKTDYRNSIKSILLSSNIEEGQPGIILLDEIQRFRSLDESGEEIREKDFQDVWMLLSDGKFDGDHTKSELTGEILEILYSRETQSLKGKSKKKKSDNGSNLKPFSVDDLMADEEDEDDEIDQSQRKFKLGYWRAQKLKRLLHLDNPIENIMTWDEDKIYDTLVDKTKTASTASFEIDYSKCLIFVSGNIDEAYKMSGMVDDADISADIIAANSKKINIIDIKKALKKRFKPEQISRLGNTHIIYPSLNSQNYRDLINKTLKEVLFLAEKSSQIKISYDNTIVDFIYKNGVFPVQGVRPVFSTINSVFNNTLPNIVLWATENHKEVIELIIVDKNILTIKDDSSLRISLEGCIDKIKKDFDIDKRTLISVHEAGHAVVYSELFKVCPQEIKSSITSWSGGYMLSNDNGQAKEQILDSVTVILAGRAAESVVFGNNLVSSGATSDIKLATAIVMNYLRGAGLGDNLARTVEPTHEDSSTCSSDTNKTCNLCEGILQEQLKKANEILGNNIEFFKDISKILIKDGEISPENYQKLAETKKMKLEIIPSEKEIFLGYKEKFDKFSL